MHDPCYAVLLQEMWRGEVEQVSWSPRAFLYKKLLSEEECDHLINHVRCALRRGPSLPRHALNNPSARQVRPAWTDWRHACGMVHASAHSQRLRADMLGNARQAVMQVLTRGQLIKTIAAS